jgi:hypothetical protein
MSNEKLSMSKQELRELLAACNNCIMDGSYSGDAMREAVRLQDILMELCDLLQDGIELELTSEGIPLEEGAENV